MGPIASAPSGRGAAGAPPSSKRGGKGSIAGRHLRDVHVVHVFDHHIGDEAQAHGVTEHDAGIGHMDVHLDQRLIALDEGAITQRRDPLANGGHVQGCALDQELHVEAIEQGRDLALTFGGLRRDRRRCRRRRPGSFSRGLFAGERAVHALQNKEKPFAAAVHLARLRQDGEQFGRVGHGFIGRAHGAGHDEPQIILQGRGALGGGRGFPHHRQDGALDGPVDAFVGDATAFSQGRREHRAGDRRLVVQAAREPAQDLGQDHPGIAPGAHQRAVGGRLRHCPRRMEVIVGDLPAGRLHRQQHIGARVPIGHGEHVERVDDLVMAVKPRQTGIEQVAQRGGVERRYGLPGAGDTARRGGFGCCQVEDPPTITSYR